MTITRHTLLLALCTMALPAPAQQSDFASPPRDARMKTWWFFGYEHTTDEGITADAEALRDAGFGGVVYYDQDHSRSPRGADDGFSPQWWAHLKHAASEARRVGLTFELNISNGYVAGGRWIEPRHAMQRLAHAACTVSGGGPRSIPLPAISGRDGYVDDVAVMAFRIADTTHMRHITARYPARGKGRNGAMQTPGKPGEFSGAGFRALPDIGTLQASDDSTTWRDIASIAPMYSSQGGYFTRTTAFPATEARHFRIKYLGDQQLKEWSVGPEAKIDRWEEKAALHSDFADDEMTPRYDAAEVICPDSIVDLSQCVGHDGVIHWHAPVGTWRVVRFAAVLTGARTKHGRRNLLGYECDKLSREAAEKHWNSYVQVILDSLQRAGIDNVAGITMDSHEGGSQNWTPLMCEEFRSRRGYDLRRFLPVMAGYVVESRERTLQVLYDLRLTIAEMMRDNYYATFQRLAAERGLSFTAQAIGNALCITGDAISVKQAVEKPQGEFWAYQQTGAYDIKDCSSAAHLYGKPISSAEALTDATYANTPLQLKRAADIALSFGAQEFVVCATPHIPQVHPTEPYIAGREYAINRSNPLWDSLKHVWLEVARATVMMRKGKAAPDVLVFLGDDLPIKTLTSRLPEGLDGLDWDVATGHALQHRIAVRDDGLLTTPDSVTYKALIMAQCHYVSPQSRAKLRQLADAGATILHSAHSIERDILVSRGPADSCIVHTHRRTATDDIYFLANISPSPRTVDVSISTPHTAASIMRTTDGSSAPLTPTTIGTYRIDFRPGESAIIVAHRQ